MPWDKATDDDRQPLIDDYIEKMGEEQFIYAFVQVRPITINERTNPKPGQDPTFMTRDVNISYKAPNSSVYRDVRATLWHEKVGDPGDLLAVLFAPPEGTTRRSANVKVQLNPEYIYGDVNPQTGRIYWKYDAKVHRVLLSKPREQDMSEIQRAAWEVLGHEWIDLHNGDGYTHPHQVPECEEEKKQPEPVGVGATAADDDEDNGLLDW